VLRSRLLTAALLGAALVCVPLPVRADPAVMSGRVLDVGGAPIEGVAVLATEPGSVGPSLIAVTDASGVYSFGALSGDEYLLFFDGTAADHQSGWYSHLGDLAQYDPGLAGTIAPGPVKDVKLLPSYLTGRVLDASSSLPLEGVVVTATRPAGAPEGTATTDTAGVYRISPLMSDEYQLHFDGSAIGYGSGFPSGTTPYVVSEEGDSYTVAPGQMREVWLLAGASLSGRVLSGGAPLQGVVVSAVPVGGSPSYDVTDEAGLYAIGGLADIAHQLYFDGTGVHHQSGWYSDATRYTVADPASADVVYPGAVKDVWLIKSYLAGRVFDVLSSAPLDGVVVTAAPPGAPVEGWATSDASGSYRITGLEGEEWQLHFDGSAVAHQSGWYSHLTRYADPGYGPGDTIAPGEVKDIFLFASFVSGQVLDAQSGNPVAGVTVAVGPPLGLAASTVTGSSGRFVVAGVTGDEFAVSFDGSAAGYEVGELAPAIGATSYVVPAGMGGTTVPGDLGEILIHPLSPSPPTILDVVSRAPGKVRLTFIAAAVGPDGGVTDDVVLTCTAPTGAVASAVYTRSGQTRGGFPSGPVACQAVARNASGSSPPSSFVMTSVR
jgi:hypothetical protein